MNAQVLSRTLLAYAVALPLAVLVGYALTNPLDAMNFVLVMSVAMVLALPILIRWWHPAVFFSWNSGLVLGFLPGTAPLWLLLAGVGFGFAVANRILDKNRRFLLPPLVTVALLLLLTVTLVTAYLRGGIGIRVLGGGVYGGKRYIYIIAAVLGYFAMVSQPIELAKVRTYLQLFYLPGLSNALGNLALTIGPAAYFVFLFIPIDAAFVQYQAMALGSQMVRLGGYTAAALALYHFLLARHGIERSFQLSAPWRALVLAGVFAISLLGGFRSALFMFVSVFVIQFLLEGLLRTRLTAILGLLAAGGLVVLLSFAEKLPLTVQRTFSFLPISVAAQARYDAMASTEWRTEMWRVIWPELPKHFWLGKGFVMDPAEIYLTEHAALRGMVKNYESAMLAGDFHNGPLSAYVPLGIFGLLSFLLFVFAVGRSLYFNYRHGDPPLRTINTFLFALFLSQTVFFLFVFGDLSKDLATFVGLIGLSVALNGGVRKPYAVPRKAQPQALWVRQPAEA